MISGNWDWVWIEFGARGFWLATTPVTVAQWERLTGEYCRPWFERHPVMGINWDNALAFIELLNRREPGAGYRLPTVAEWEHTCGQDKEGFLYEEPSGPSTAVDWQYVQNASTVYSEPTLGTHPVCASAPNLWGLYDMLGQVWQWCEPGVLCGGGAHCAERHPCDRNASYSRAGLRLAREGDVL